METCKYGSGADKRKPTAVKRKGVVYRAYRWQVLNWSMTYQLLKVESRGICRQWGEWHEKDCNHRGRKWNVIHSVQLARLVDEWGWIGGYAPCHRPETPCCDKVNIQGWFIDGVGSPTETGNFQWHLANVVWLSDDCCPLLPYKLIRGSSVSCHHLQEIVRGKREK